MKYVRWSLRTAILLIAALGLLMGVGAWFRSRLVARGRAIAAIDRKHGTYGVRINGPAWYRALVNRLGGDDTMFYDPLRVSLGPGNAGYDPASPIRDADLAELAGTLAQFTNLDLLDLRSTEVTDRGLAALPMLPSLKIIRLDGSRVTAKGVAGFRRRYPGCRISHPDFGDPAVTIH